MSAAQADVEEMEWAFVRSQVYGILARCLADPSHLADEALLDDLEGLTSDRPELRGPVAGLRAAIREERDDPRKLEQEFTRLLVKAEAPPYEGSYVPGFRLTQELADIGGFLGAFGLRARGERPDYLVTELEFMALLCLKEAVARGRGLADGVAVCRDAQVKFLRDHLGRWVPLFQEAVAQRAGLRSYAALALLLREVVSRDAAALGVVPEKIVEVPHEDPESLPGCGLAR